MNKTIELPSEKIIDLNRFIALIPDDEATDNTYCLILEGYDQAIALDSQEAITIKERLNLESKHDQNGAWDREQQLRKNQPAIELLKKRIARNKLMSDTESNQRAKFLADFQKTVDEQRVSERKLYTPE